DLGAGARVPQPGGGIKRRSHDAVARRAEGSRIDSAIMIKDRDLGPGPTVPHPRRRVVRRRYNSVARWAEVGGMDNFVMPEDGDLGSGAGIPQQRRAARPADGSDDAVARRAEGGVQDWIIMLEDHN